MYESHQELQIYDRQQPHAITVDPHSNRECLEDSFHPQNVVLKQLCGELKEVRNETFLHETT